MAVTLDAAVASFGASLKVKLSNPAIQGAPEDQLRAPLEKLIVDLAEASGLPAGAVSLVGETTLGALPDYPKEKIFIPPTTILCYKNEH